MRRLRLLSAILAALVAASSFAQVGSPTKTGSRNPFQTPLPVDATITGIWTFPTAAAGTSSTRAATTAFVQNEKIGVDVARLATSGNGTSGSPWAGWEAAVNALPTNTLVVFREGNFTQSTGIIIKRGWRVVGAGEVATTITSAIAGTAFRTNFSLNASTDASVYVGHLAIVNTNASNNGSGLLDVGGTYVHFDHVRVEGFKFGIALVQSEIAKVTYCHIRLPLAIGLWIVNGGDYNTTNADLDFSAAAGNYTNQITTTGNQFNVGATKTGMADDGGYAHVHISNNFNSGNPAMRIVGVTGGTVVGGEVETGAGVGLHLGSTKYFGGSGGATTGFAVRNTFFLTGSYCIEIGAAAGITFDGPTFSSSAAYAVYMTDPVSWGGPTIMNYALSGGAAITNSTNATIIDRGGSGATAQIATQNLKYRGAQLQAFQIKLNNNGGVLRHKFVSDDVLGTLGLTNAEKVTGATTTYQNTPTLGPAVAFVNGGGISAGGVNRFVLNVAAQTMVAAVVTVDYADAGMEVKVIHGLLSENVNGVTQNRIYLILLKNDGTAFNPTVDLGVGKSLTINFFGFIQ